VSAFAENPEGNGNHQETLNNVEQRNVWIGSSCAAGRKMGKSCIVVTRLLMFHFSLKICDIKINLCLYSRTMPRAFYSFFCSMFVTCSMGMSSEGANAIYRRKS
jgi:hypothetical protein